MLIHAVYLLNCASEDKEIRGKSLTALTAALQAGAALGVVGVVLHPGSALKDDVDAAITRAAKTIAEALEESENCALHLEDTAGAGGTLGRSFEELASLIEQAGGGKRLAVCLDSCHLSPPATTSALRRGCRRSSTSSTPSSGSTGSRRCTSTTRPPRSAPTSTATRRPAEGTRPRGLRGLPVRAALRGHAADPGGAGPEGKGIVQEDIAFSRELREEGLKARKR